MRPEKNSIIQDILAKVNGSPFILLTDYTGLKVDQFSELRNRLAASGAEYKVVKNTLFQKALTEAKITSFDDLLTGQTAIVVGNKDVCAAAKVLKNFSAEFTKPKIKAGVLDGDTLSTTQIMELADLPSREVLLGKILGLLQAPAGQLVRILNTPGSQLAQVLKAKSELPEAAPSAPAASAPAETAPAAAEPTPVAGAAPEAAAPVEVAKTE